MMTMWYLKSLIVLVFLFLVEARKEKCDICLPINSCSFYGNLTREEQARWMERFECPKSEKEDLRPPFGFAPSAKGDVVCCPNSIWGTNTNDNEKYNNKAEYNIQPDYKPPSNRDSSVDNRSNRPSDNLSKNSYDAGSNRPSDNDYYSNYDTYRAPHSHQARQSYNQANWAPRPGNDWNRNNQNIGGNGNTFNRNGNYGNPYAGNDNPFNKNGNSYNGNNLGQNVNDNSFGRNDNSFRGNGDNRNEFGSGRNSYGGNGNPVGGNGNSLGGFGNQCPVTYIPPSADSGCCGREATDSDRITGRQPWPSRNEGRQTERPWKSPMDDYRNWNTNPRFRRQTANVTVDNRIAGGRETDLEQFPWTVLLKTTFDYGTSEAAFNCGGSLISSYYVLTAGHCVVDESARVKDVEIFLAEYDKRTFPRDCKNVLGEGRKCVENIVTRAQSVLPHPNYDNDRLFNDIALIRVQRPAPHTDYIRPICLPPINVDEPDFFNLRLAVAGWGRNGKYKSDIKQSTVVNLVPNRECRQYYPNLSKSQLCAAGYSGEDTCKGDSGGPLMLLYEGKYFVSGVVSGKRADAPCGTSVPSLYTNVYQHLDWIRKNIRN